MILLHQVIKAGDIFIFIRIIEDVALNNMKSVVPLLCLPCLFRIRDNGTNVLILLPISRSSPMAIIGGYHLNFPPKVSLTLHPLKGRIVITWKFISRRFLLFISQSSLPQGVRNTIPSLSSQHLITHIKHIISYNYQVRFRQVRIVEILVIVVEMNI